MEKEANIRKQVCDIMKAIDNDSNNFKSLNEKIYNANLVSDFIKTENGKFLKSWKKIIDILDIEESKIGRKVDPFVDYDKLCTYEKNLFSSMTGVYHNLFVVNESHNANKFERLDELNYLSKPIDKIFNNLDLGIQDKLKRKNRYGLLAMLRETVHKLVDFSKIIT